MASVVRDEAFLDGQLQIAGSSQSRILERLEKSKNDMKRQSNAQKIVYSFLLGILPIMPAMTYVQMTGLLLGSSVQLNTVIFISVLILSIYFGMVFMYILVLGVMAVSGFMSGDVFQWLEVLPIPRKDIQKVGFIVLWRFFDIPMIVVIGTFPTIMALVTGSVLVFFTCLGATLLNSFFLFCILILITEKFSRMLKGSTTNSRKATLLRTLAMLGYVIAMMSIGLVFNLAMQSIGLIITGLTSLENMELANILFSLLPFPFAPSFLVTLTLLPPGIVPAPLLASTVGGVCILAIVTWRLYLRVLSKLRNITSHQARMELFAVQKPVGSVQQMDKITPVSPVKAFSRKDIASLTRDFRGAMYLFMPLIYPFLFILPSIYPLSAGLITGVQIYIYLLIFMTMLTLLSACMLVSGLLSMEDSGTSIMASLPVIPRDQAKAKLKLICVIQFISSMIPLAISAGLPDIASVALFYFSYCIVSIDIVLLTFVTKVGLFGKLRYKYVLEEANVNRKVQKWLAIVCFDGAVLVGLIIVTINVGFMVSVGGMLLVLSCFGSALLVLLLLVFNKMFPRIDLKKKSETPLS